MKPKKLTKPAMLKVMKTVIFAVSGVICVCGHVWSDHYIHYIYGDHAADSCRGRCRCRSFRPAKFKLNTRTRTLHIADEPVDIAGA